MGFLTLRGRIYQRGTTCDIAYRMDGREYRESARSTDRVVAERLLGQKPAPYPRTEEPLEGMLS